MICDTCEQPVYQRVVDTVKRDGKPQDVLVNVHSDTHIVQCEDSGRGI